MLRAVEARYKLRLEQNKYRFVKISKSRKMGINDTELRSINILFQHLRFRRKQRGSLCESAPPQCPTTTHIEDDLQTSEYGDRHDEHQIHPDNHCYHHASFKVLYPPPRTSALRHRRVICRYLQELKLVISATVVILLTFYFYHKLIFFIDLSDESVKWMISDLSCSLEDKVVEPDHHGNRRYKGQYKIGRKVDFEVLHLGLLLE